MPTMKRKSRPPAEPPPEPAVVPMMAFGPSPFAPRDEADGAIVDGYRLVRAPDGTLVGIAEPSEPEKSDG